MFNFDELSFTEHRVDMEPNQMGCNANGIAPMPDNIGQSASTHPSPSTHPFSRRLILSKIANTDQIIRLYHEKSAECQRVQESLASITGTVDQVRQMYQHERDQAERYANENELLSKKVTGIEAQLQEVNNDLVNSSTLSQQTIADLEYKLQKKSDEYLALCQEFMEQSSMLNENSLATPQMQRRSLAIKYMLQNNGIACDLVMKRKPAAESRRKSKVAPTSGIKADAVVVTAPKVKMRDAQTQYEPSKNTCEKGTQYHLSRATRSTCTSTFIKMTEMGTNTDPDDVPNDFNRIDTIFDEMISSPLQHCLTPLRDSDDETTDLAASSSSTIATQTETKRFSNQETITIINNVQHRVHYVDEKMPAVKTENATIPMRPLCQSCPGRADGYASAPALQQIWSILGEMLFTMVGAAADAKVEHSIHLMKKIHEIQLMISEHVPKDASPNDLLDKTQPIEMDQNGCIDELSRDSVESYNSANVIISQARNLSSCSPVPDERRRSPDVEQHHFTPITIADKKQCSNPEPVITNTRLKDTNKRNSPIVMERSSSPTPPPLPVPVSQRRSQRISRLKCANVLKRPNVRASNGPVKAPPFIETNQSDDNAMDTVIESPFKKPANKRRLKVLPSKDQKKCKKATVIHTYDQLNLTVIFY